LKERVIALSGGIGGAKLALGLANILDPQDLMIVANTGDDFEYMGLPVCPDTDTLLYTLGGICNTETGWGRAEETWAFMEALEKESPNQAWFRLGDKDIETHRYRKQALADGNTLTKVIADLAQQFGVSQTIVPMSDDPVHTWVLAETEAGIDWLPFQEYFVKHQCGPRIHRIEYRGSQLAAVSPQLEAALTTPNTRAVVICPSNPFLSIDPILAVPGMVNLLRNCHAPVIAVSPVVGGRALKGPTAKIMKELGMAVDVAAIAEHYLGIIDGLVIDDQDRDQLESVQTMGVPTMVTNTVMVSLEDRKQLARDILSFAVEFENNDHHKDQSNEHNIENKGDVGSRSC